MIESIQNNRVKNWRKLHTRKGRKAANLFLIEGNHLIEEAWKSNWNIEELIIQRGIEVPDWCEKQSVTYVNETVFNHIAQTKTPQGIAAVITKKQTAIFTGDYVLLVDRVQDPGNLGTIIRTADAAGFSAVILGEGTVDLYNDKVIRATQGSLFHIPIIEESILEQIKQLKQDNFIILATALSGATMYNQVDVTNKVGLIVGNEGSGIQDSIMEAADKFVKIPIYGKAESLNVSVAAGIIMYYLKGKLAH